MSASLLFDPSKLRGIAEGAINVILGMADFGGEMLQRIFFQVSVQ